MGRVQWRRVVLTLAAGAVGCAVNLLPVTVFGPVKVVFGSVLSLLIAIVYGPVYGLAAALIASTSTVRLWGHGYGVLTFGLEALVVGWLVAHRRQSPLWAELRFWAFPGLPLLIWIYLIHFDYPSPNGLAIVVKEPLNGLLAVMLAELLAWVGPVQRLLLGPEEATARRPLRAYLYHAFLLLARCRWRCWPS